MKTRILLVLIAACSLFASCANSKPDDSTTKFAYTQNGDPVAIITPTFSQGQYYAYKSGNGVGVSISVACMVLFAGVIILLSIGKIQMGKGPGGAMFVLLCGIFAGFLVKGSQVWLNNNKEIPIAEYKTVIEKDGNSKAIWDMYYEQNRLIDAASK